MSLKDKIFKLNPKKKIEVPVLLICFNRPKQLTKTLKLLLKYKVKNLYVFQDGCPNNNSKNCQKHIEVKKILKEFELAKKIKIYFAKKNLGKKFGPPTAITWFFKNFEKGVIIEDDTLPSKSFLLMAEILLKEHENDKKVFQICGTGVLSKNFGNITYASPLPFIHGWATWRNRWKLYSQKIGNLKELSKNKNFNKNIKSFINKVYWLNIFKNYKENKYKTWDYPMVYHCMINDYICIKPSVNMITNIGYTEKNQLSLRKRYEIKKFHNLKNIKNFFKKENEKEGWVYSVSLRYQFSLIRKFLLGYLK